MENKARWIKEIEPTLLNEEELSNPVLVIRHLFELSDLQYLKRDVWECLKAALADKPFCYLNEPLLVFNMQKEIGRLCDAMFLLLKMKEASDGEILIKYSAPGSKEMIGQERMFMLDLDCLLDEYKGKIIRLCKAEVRNPYLTVRAFFDFQTPNEWKSLLNSWAEHALSKMTISEDLVDNSVLLEFEYLEKIIEVAWLLKNHAKERNETDKKLKITEALKETPLRFEIEKSFINFLESAPASRLNRCLRKMFLDYLSKNIDSLPPDIEGFLLDFYHLSNLLDVIESKPQDWHKREVD